jgi:hypothetical protein
MHFLGASRDGLVARPVEMDKLSSSDSKSNYGFDSKTLTFKGTNIYLKVVIL